MEDTRNNRNAGLRQTLIGMGIVIGTRSGCPSILDALSGSKSDTVNYKAKDKDRLVYNRFYIKDVLAARLNNYSSAFLGVFLLLCINAGAKTQHSGAHNNTPSSFTAANFKPANKGTQGAPLAFIENAGQVTDQYGKLRKDINYQIKAANGLTIFIGDGAIHYQFAKATETGMNSGTSGAGNHEDRDPEYDMYRMDVQLVGANKHAQMIAEQKQSYYENHFTNSVGNGGATAHFYTRITYKEVYPNIDWVLYISSGKLKHEFVVHPGGKPGDIQLKYDGATSLKLTTEGDLNANTPQGPIMEQAPYAYQNDGKKVNCGFRLDGVNLRYETGSYTGELTIDPTLTWATYYGGSGADGAYDITTDGGGNLYIAGKASSVSSIATTGAYQTTYGGGSYDAFLVKSNSAGVMQWATYYGGSNVDIAFGVAADAGGNVYIAGQTLSTSGIATAGAYQTVAAGQDAFLAKFNSSGALQWGTYLGGPIDELAQNVAVDGSGNVYIAGFSDSPSGVATAGAYQTVFGGGDDAFLAKFNSAGVMQWSTYFGGSGYDDGWMTAVDLAGNVYLTGRTQSTSAIATAGAYQTTYGGGVNDVFLAKFTSAGTLLWGTYYGGGGNDYGLGLATEESGNVYITGSTESTSAIATAGAHQTTFGGGTTDNFLAKFNGTGAIQWSTYYGGGGDERGEAISVSASGNVYITGQTTSPSAIATAGAYQSIFGGTQDAFLAKFDAAGVRQWATYYGGSSIDQGVGVATHGCDVYMAGWTQSASSIATAGAYQTTFGGSWDAFIVDFYDASGPLSPITGTTAVCVGEATTLSNTTGGGLWGSGNAAIGSVSSAGIVTGISPGTTSVFYALPGGCTATVVTVNALPAITGLTPMQLCQGSGAVLTGLPSGGTWISSTISAGTIGLTTGIANGIAAGTTTVTYTAGTGCKNTAILTVNGLPAAIGGTPTVCVGSITTLNDLTAGGTWSASPGTGSVSVSSSGNVTGVSAGTATVSYTITATGCYVTQAVTVNAVPVPVPISGPAVVCPAAAITLSNASTGGVWTSGNTAVATVNATGIVTGVSSGTVNISYGVTGSCGTGYAIYTVTVDPLPNAGAITGSSNVCVGSLAALSDAVPGGVWSSGSVSVATITSAGVVTGASAGTTSITYAVTNSCGTAVAGMVVSVNPMPSAGSITGAAVVCVAANTVLSDATPGGVWSSVVPFIATVSGGTVTGVAPGTSVISYTVTNGFGCVSAATATITVIAAPVVTTSPSGSEIICSGGTISLNGSPAAAGLTYQWQESGTDISGATTSVYNTGAAGNYQISITNPSGCTGTSAVVIVSVGASGTVTPTVTVSSGAGAAICASATPVLFTATPANGGSSPGYAWSVNGTPVTGTGNTYSYVPANGDIVQCVLTSSSPCAVPATATNSITMTVTPSVTPSVVVSPAPNDTVCTGAGVTYTAVISFGGTAPAYSWTENGIPVASGPVYATVPHDGDVIVCQLTSNYTPCLSVPSVLSTPLTMTVQTPTVNSVVISTPSSTIAPGSTITFVAIAPNAGTSPAYQWFIGTTAVTGATAATFTTNTLTDADVVYCKVTSSDICALPHVGLSNGITITVTPASEVDKLTKQGASILLEPNPNNGNFRVTGTLNDAANTEVEVVVTNMIGQVVYSHPAECNNGSINHSMSLSNLPNGVYMLRIRSDNEYVALRFVVNK